MKNKIITSILILGTTTLFAQQIDTTLIKEIPTIKNNVFQQRQDINALQNQVNNQSSIIQQQSKTLSSLNQVNNQQKKSIDSLSNVITNNSNNITTNSDKLGTEITRVTSDRNSQISALDSTIGKNRLYWIIASLGTLLLGAFMYLFLGKRIKSSKTDVETQIRNTKQSLEEESVRLNTKLVEILETQLKVNQEETKEQKEEEKDHSLVLKVADEVTKIQMNLEVMDSNIRGYKHLKKYSQSILDNLKAYGYEIPVLLGTEYNSGLNMVATLEFDENIEEGKQIIKRIIKPQVNYNKVMIQAAKVTVAFND
jgi:hypothetical protein